jgi:hypothetical protein
MIRAVESFDRLATREGATANHQYQLKVSYCRLREPVASKAETLDEDPSDQSRVSPLTLTFTLSLCECA